MNKSRSIRLMYLLFLYIYLFLKNKHVEKDPLNALSLGDKWKQVRQYVFYQNRHRSKLNSERSDDNYPKHKNEQSYRWLHITNVMKKERNYRKREKRKVKEKEKEKGRDQHKEKRTERGRDREKKRGTERENEKGYDKEKEKGKEVEQENEQQKVKAEGTEEKENDNAYNKDKPETHMKSEVEAEMDRLQESISANVPFHRGGKTGPHFNPFIDFLLDRVQRLQQRLRTLIGDMQSQNNLLNSIYVSHTQNFRNFRRRRRRGGGRRGRGGGGAGAGGAGRRRQRESTWGNRDNWKNSKRWNRQLLEGKVEYDDIVNTYGNSSKTVVNFFHFFTSPKQLNPEIDENPTVNINAGSDIHRIVIFCFKPSVENLSVVGMPSEAPFQYLNMDRNIVDLDKNSMFLLYNKLTAWGSDNLLSSGSAEIIITPYIRGDFRFTISCLNKKESGIYKRVAYANVEIGGFFDKRDLIQGISNFPEDVENFRYKVDESVNEYLFDDVFGCAVILKLADATLDPPDCPKMAYIENDDSRPYFMMLLYTKMFVFVFDTPGVIHRWLSVKDEPGLQTFNFHCYFQTNSGTKKKILFNPQVSVKHPLGSIPVNKIFYVKNEKEKYVSPSYKVDIEVCNFEYTPSYEALVCERFLREFTLLIYNCDSSTEPDNPEAEPFTNIKFADYSSTINKFSAIPLYKDHIKLHDVTKNFENFRFFMTPYIDTGNVPFAVECVVKKKGEPSTRQKAYIYIHMEASYNSGNVRICDFTLGQQYSLMNSYEGGPECAVNISVNSIFAIKCPDKTKKKPANCFTEVYIRGQLTNLKEKLIEKFIPYSESIETIAVGSFHNYITRSYNFECYCVNKTNENEILYTAKMRYKNDNHVDDYTMFDSYPYPSLHLGPYQTHFCDFMNTDVLVPIGKTPVNYMCNVYPKPLDYVVLSCPKGEVDGENEKIIEGLSDVDSVKYDKRADKYFNKRSRYLNFKFVPHAAPVFVIDKKSNTIAPIAVKIPGVMLRNIIDLKFMYRDENFMRLDSDFSKVRKVGAENKKTIYDQTYSSEGMNPKVLRDLLNLKTSKLMKTTKEKKEKYQNFIPAKIVDTTDIRVKPRPIITELAEEITGFTFFETLNQEAINKAYDKYIGLQNDLSSGFIFFQIPPYIKNDIDIQFACLNSESIIDNKKGNNGIMTVSLRSAGQLVEGCHFYNQENFQIYKIFTQDINIQTQEECNVIVNRGTTYIGVMCSTSEKLWLEPTDCLLEYYDELNSQTMIDQDDPYFEHFSDRQGTVYLKIPPFFIKYVKMICFCHTTNAGGTQKKSTITVTINSHNEHVKRIHRINADIQPNVTIGTEYNENEIIPITRNKATCDFTTKENRLSPTDSVITINYCYLEVTDNISMVEIKCPKKVASAPKTKKKKVKVPPESELPPESEADEADQKEKEEEDEEDEEDEEEEKDEEEEDEGEAGAQDLNNKYAKIKYIPDNFNEEITYKGEQKKLESILPGIFLKNKDVPFSKEGTLFFVSPLIVKESLNLQIVCDNSETTYKGNVGKKGTVYIEIFQTNYEGALEGCNFSETKDTSYYFTQSYDLKESDAFCKISLKPNMVVGLNCPVGKLNPNSCFSTVFVQGNYGDVLEEQIQFIFKKVKVIKNDFLGDSATSFLFISEITNEELEFYCHCVHLKTNHVGTIHIQNKKRLQYIKSNLHISAAFVPTDVAPAFVNNTYVCDFDDSGYSIKSQQDIDLVNIQMKYLQDATKSKKHEYSQLSVSLKVKKDLSHKTYIEYIKNRINELSNNPTGNIGKWGSLKKAYRCKVDLNIFDSFRIRCPANEKTQKANPFKKLIIYDTSIGSTEEAMHRNLNHKLYGTLISSDVVKKSFFNTGEMEFIMPPYVRTNQVIDFMCIYCDKGMPKSIGIASLFIRKNAKKILGCDFYKSDNKHVTGSSVGQGELYLTETKESTREQKEIYEFEMEMREGLRIYCNIDAVENDIVGFKCPTSFITIPPNCFDTVKTEGENTQEQIIKIRKLIKGAKILYNGKYSNNSTPAYLILPNKIEQSLFFYCTCNSLNTLQTGVIRVNVVGEDLKKRFKKHITTTRHTYQLEDYVYDFTKGVHNISSHGVLFQSQAGKEKSSHVGAPLEPLSLKNTTPAATHSQSKGIFSVTTQMPRKGRFANMFQQKTGADTTELHILTRGDEDSEDLEDHDESIEHVDDHDDRASEPLPQANQDAEGSKTADAGIVKEAEEDEEQDDAEEDSALNNLRTKHVYEYDITVSEFGKVKIICPVRDSLEHSQIKLIPDNFFEYVYVFNEDETESRELHNIKNKGYDGDFFDPEYIKGIQETEVTEEKKENEEPPKKVVLDPSHNFLVVQEKKKDAPLPVKESKPIERTANNKNYLIIKHIHDVVSFVNYKNEIVDKKYYTSVLNVSPVILHDADFFVSCDNSLTLNGHSRGKLAIVRIRIKSNHLRIDGCDFTGNYDSIFNYSTNWETAISESECNVGITHTNIVGIACPAHAELQPNNCFEAVLHNGKVVKGDSLYKTKHIFLFKKTNADILAFLQIEKGDFDKFSCKCYGVHLDTMKEATMEITLTEHSLSEPSGGMNRSVYDYV